MTAPKGPRLRIPLRLQMLGYTIRVRVIAGKEMAALVEGQMGVEGVWDDKTHTIYIYRGLTARQKRLALLHEVQHALIDISDWERDRA